MTKKSTIHCFRKAIRVIDSCENELHLKGAQKYINNFLISHSEETPEVVNRFAILKVDPFTESAYNRLQVQLNNKTQGITNE